jgi:hypothetical protein
MQKNWTIGNIWNTKLNVERKDAKERDYISASDIGKPYLDRFYKMKGIKVTNPFDERILRVFECGNIFEWIVERVFKLAGILQESQTWIEIPATKTRLKVVGKLDFLVGGIPNWNVARANVKDTTFEVIRDHIDTIRKKLKELDFLDDTLVESAILRISEKPLPEWLERKALKFIDELQKKYPNGIKSLTAEIKSVNSMAFWAHKNRTKDGFFAGYEHNKLQLLTYIIATKQEEGRLFYISKDDLTLEETPIGSNTASKELLNKWNKDVKEMSEYYRTNIIPPKEPDVIFNENKKKYELNWKVGRSSYLTKITGFKNKDDWDKATRTEVNAKNKIMRDELKQKEKQKGKSK